MKMKIDTFRREENINNGTIRQKLTLFMKSIPHVHTCNISIFGDVPE